MKINLLLNVLIFSITIGLTTVNTTHAKKHAQDKLVPSSLEEHQFEGHRVARFSWPEAPPEYVKMKMEWESHLKSYLVNDLNLSSENYQKLKEIKKEKADRLSSWWEPLEKRIEEKFGKGYQILWTKEDEIKAESINKEYNQKTAKILGETLYPKYVAYRNKYRALYFDQLQKKYGKYTAAFFVE